jgi:hypothetical protein
VLIQRISEEKKKGGPISLTNKTRPFPSPNLSLSPVHRS